MKKENKLLEKKILNWFATRNQYSSWKEVVKDSQSLLFEAKEFENVIKDVIRETKKEILDELDKCFTREDILKLKIKYKAKRRI